MAGVINELQAIVECPEDHWTKVAKEFRLANEMLCQKRDQLISLVRKVGVADGWVIVVSKYVVGWYHGIGCHDKSH